MLITPDQDGIPPYLDLRSEWQPNTSFEHEFTDGGNLTMVRDLTHYAIIYSGQVDPLNLLMGIHYSGLEEPGKVAANYHPDVTQYFKEVPQLYADAHEEQEHLLRFQLSYLDVGVEIHWVRGGRAESSMAFARNLPDLARFGFHVLPKSVRASLAGSMN